MKTLAIVLISTLSLATAMAQNTAPAAKPATATTVPAKAEAPKEEMKLAKKKDAPKADTKSEAKPASPAKADDKKAEASKK